MKLLRKDVLKWIKNLQSGRYKKGKGSLVVNNGAGFCCLGVWADQHGATWDDYWCPIPKGRVNRTKEQESATGFLRDPKLARGLDTETQSALAKINDLSKDGFRSVVKYIKKEVLPKAK